MYVDVDAVAAAVTCYVIDRDKAYKDINWYILYPCDFFYVTITQVTS